MEVCCTCIRVRRGRRGGTERIQLPHLGPASLAHLEGAPPHPESAHGRLLDTHHRIQQSSQRQTRSPPVPVVGGYSRDTVGESRQPRPASRLVRQRRLAMALPSLEAARPTTFLPRPVVAPRGLADGGGGQRVPEVT